MTGVCSLSLRIERLRRHVKALGRDRRGKQQHVLGVAVGRVGAAQEVALLRARRHTRGTDPVRCTLKMTAGYFGVVREAR